MSLNFPYLRGKLRNFIRGGETWEANEHKNNDSSAGLFAFGKYVYEKVRMLDKRNPVFVHICPLEGFLSSGQGAASKVLSRFITKLNIPATHLGTPRARALSKVDSQMQSETGIEDQPEIEPEPELQTELEGMFLFLFYYI